jgi:hypothetical protein
MSDIDVLLCKGYTYKFILDKSDIKYISHFTGIKKPYIENISAAIDARIVKDIMDLTDFRDR